jgi:hypothetical protein
MTDLPTDATKAFRASMMANFGPRQVMPFTGDYSTYGQAGGAHTFFAPFTPGPAPAPGAGGPGVPGVPGVPEPNRPNAPGGMGHLSTKELIKRLREASQQTGQKLTKSDRKAVRHLSTDPNIRATQIIDIFDRGLGWVQDPLGGVLGMAGLENPLGMSNFGVTGVAAGLGRKALGAGRDFVVDRIVDRNRAGTPAERERENWNDRVREATRTGNRIGGPV